MVWLEVGHVPQHALDALNDGGARIKRGAIRLQPLQAGARKQQARGGRQQQQEGGPDVAVVESLLSLLWVTAPHPPALNRRVSHTPAALC